MQNSITPEGVFVRTKEAAAAIPMALRTFEKAVAARKIPSYKFGRSRLFKIDEVIRAVEACRVATTREVLS